MPEADQPIPLVTDADVERVVRRDFGANQLKGVLLLLGQYGKDSSDREPARVRLAVLKLAGGNIGKLKHALKTAKEDYRDVLAYAEYPAYFQNISPSEPNAARKQRAINADWQQYRDWLDRK